MSKKSILAAAALACGLAVSGAASANTIVLNFEGIGAFPFDSNITVGDFYNGGTSSAGTSGTDFGVGFSNNALALCLNSDTVFCSNTSRGGLGDPGSQQGAMFFNSGSAAYMNVAAGFDTGFSFYYSSPFFTAEVAVYDGLNGTGNVLASVILGLTPLTACGSFPGNYCPFVEAGIAFAGTARSVGFGGNNSAVYDDVTFGSVTPGVPTPQVPLPAGFPLLAAALVGLGALRRRSRG